MGKTRKAISALGLVAALFFVGQVQANSVKITIDTLGLNLSGTIWDLTFDFSSSNLLPNSVTIFDFAITGDPPDSGLIGPGIAAFGNVSGDLSSPPGTVVLNDYDPIDSCCAEYLHNAKLGGKLEFKFTISGLSDSTSDPDTFALFFLDDNGLAFPTADPTGALFVYSIGNDDQPTLYPPQDCPDCVRAEQLPDVPGVPEPGVLVLAMAGLLALGVVRSITNGSVAEKAGFVAGLRV